jgi:hypothetical protein
MFAAMPRERQRSARQIRIGAHDGDLRASLNWDDLRCPVAIAEARSLAAQAHRMRPAIDEMQSDPTNPHRCPFGRRRRIDGAAIVADTSGPSTQGRGRVLTRG